MGLVIKGVGEPATRRKSRKRANLAGSVEAGGTYTLADLEKRLGLGPVAVREAIKNGLDAPLVGHVKLVTGCAINRYVRMLARRERLAKLANAQESTSHGN